DAPARCVRGRRPALAARVAGRSARRRGAARGAGGSAMTCRRRTWMACALTLVLGGCALFGQPRESFEFTGSDIARTEVPPEWENEPAVVLLSEDTITYDVAQFRSITRFRHHEARLLATEKAVADCEVRIRTEHDEKLVLLKARSVSPGGVSEDVE